MLYSEIRANETVGRAIGALYMSAPDDVITCEARKAYDAFIRQTEAQFEDVARCVNVIFQDADPYGGRAQEMFDDVNHNRTLRVYRTVAGEDHPYMTNTQNDLFRAVHDFNGHYRAGTGFDRHGEEGAYQCHARTYSGLARRAMTTETRGQNSALVWALDGAKFPPQKAIILPTWVTDGLAPDIEEWFAVGGLPGDFPGRTFA